MIPQSYRFHSRADVARVYRKGETIRGTQCAMKVVHGQPRTIIAVVVSKKVNKSAVVRNRIRRRVFEYIRKDNWFTGLPPYGCVISIYDDAFASIPAEELGRRISSLFEKGGVKRTPNSGADAKRHAIVEEKTKGEK